MSLASKKCEVLTGETLWDWRRGSESNRRTRSCSPLHDHSATAPMIVFFYTILVYAGHLPALFPAASAGAAIHYMPLCHRAYDCFFLHYSRVRRTSTGSFSLCKRWSCNPLCHLASHIAGTLHCNDILERERRLELPTSTLARLRSTN
jgi:hypothetical protein